MLNADGSPVVPSPWKTLGQGAATYVHSNFSVIGVRKLNFVGYRQVIGAFDPSLVPFSGAFLNDGAVYDNAEKPLPDFITSDVSF